MVTIAKIGELVGCDDGRGEPMVTIAKIGELVGCDDGRGEPMVMIAKIGELVGCDDGRGDSRIAPTGKNGRSGGSGLIYYRDKCRLTRSRFDEMTMNGARCDRISCTD